MISEDRAKLAGIGASFVGDRVNGVTCCICFVYVTPDQLHVDTGGVMWDVCTECAESENM